MPAAPGALGGIVAILQQVYEQAFERTLDGVALVAAQGDNLLGQVLDAKGRPVFCLQSLRLRLRPGIEIGVTTTPLLQTSIAETF